VGQKFNMFRHFVDRPQHVRDLWMGKNCPQHVPRLGDLVGASLTCLWIEFRSSKCR